MADRKRLIFHLLRIVEDSVVPMHCSLLRKQDRQGDLSGNGHSLILNRDSRIPAGIIPDESSQRNLDGPESVCGLEYGR